MVLQAAAVEGIRSRAEVQRRWVSQPAAIVLFSASQRLCARTYWFRPQAGLGSSAFISGPGIDAGQSHEISHDEIFSLPGLKPNNVSR